MPPTSAKSGKSSVNNTELYSGMRDAQAWSEFDFLMKSKAAQHGGPFAVAVYQDELPVVDESSLAQWNTEFLASKAGLSFKSLKESRLESILTVEFHLARIKQMKYDIYQIIVQHTSGDARAKVQSVEFGEGHLVREKLHQAFGMLDEDELRQLENRLKAGLTVVDGEGDETSYRRPRDGEDILQHLDNFAMLKQRIIELIGVERSKEYPCLQEHELCKSMIESLPPEYSDIMIHVKLMKLDAQWKIVEDTIKSKYQASYQNAKIFYGKDPLKKGGVTPTLTQGQLSGAARKRKFDERTCYDCGQTGHNRGSPLCRSPRPKGDSKRRRKNERCKFGADCRHLKGNRCWFRHTKEEVRAAQSGEKESDSSVSPALAQSIAKVIEKVNGKLKNKRAAEAKKENDAALQATLVQMATAFRNSQTAAAANAGAVSQTQPPSASGQSSLPSFGTGLSTSAAGTSGTGGGPFNFLNLGTGFCCADQSTGGRSSARVVSQVVPVAFAGVDFTDLTGIDTDSAVSVGNRKQQFLWLQRDVPAVKNGAAMIGSGGGQRKIVAMGPMLQTVVNRDGHVDYLIDPLGNYIPDSPVSVFCATNLKMFQKALIQQRLDDQDVIVKSTTGAEIPIVIQRKLFCIRNHKSDARKFAVTDEIKSIISMVWNEDKTLKADAAVLSSGKQDFVPATSLTPVEQ